MQIDKTQFSSIGQMTGQYLKHVSSNTRTEDNAAEGSFKEVLTKKVDQSGTLTFTKHANQRLDSRDIVISSEQMQRLEDGARRAGEKGIKESLVLVDSLAFIVNTRQNTVITAMNQSQTDESIYTNIDGAVII